MKRSYFVALIIVVLAAIWMISGAIFEGDNSNKNQLVNASSESSGQEQTLQNIRAAQLQAQTFTDRVEVTGISQASKSVILRAEVAAAVERVHREEGAQVERGDLLVSLDKDNRQEAVSEAKLLVAQREQEFQAAQKLAAEGFTSDIRLKETRASLEQAEAALARARLALENTQIRAPFDGVLNTQYVEVGDFVSVGEQIYHMVALDPIEFVGYVTEGQRLRLRIGKIGTAKLYEGKSLPVELTYLAPAADPETRTFRIIATAENADNKIADGLTAKLDMPVDERPGYKVSPAVLTLADSGQVGVKLLDENNIVSFHPVEILEDANTHIWLGGLPDQINLVTVGQDFIVEGQEVAPSFVQTASGEKEAADLDNPMLDTENPYTRDNTSVEVSE